MAGEENSDYESDPEEVKMMSMKMRRREASDDEVDENRDDDDDDGSCSPPKNSRSGIAVEFDGDLDDQGGAADYDDENDVEEYDEEEDEEEEEYYDEYEEEDGGEAVEREIGVVVKAENGGGEAGVAVEDGGGDGEVKEGEGEGEGEGEEKKEVEPFSVPTSGAFYMHDDRFRGNAAGGGGRGGGRNRRTFGGRKLWESKDERKWGHDKFEELNLHDKHYDEGRRPSRGSYQGRGKPRGAGGGYSRGGKARGYSGNNTQNAAPKDVRGRGPRRYQPLTKNKGETHPPQYKQSARSYEKRSHSGSGRMASSTGSSNVEHEVASAKKLGSNLSSASPPFYPSGSSTKDVASTQKKEMHTGNLNKNMYPSSGPKFSMPASNHISKGKNVLDSTGIDKLHSNDTSPASNKAYNNLHLQSSSSLSTPNQFAHPRGQGRVVGPSKPTVSQSPQTNNIVNKVSPQATQANQQSLVLSQGHSPRLQAPGQQLAQRPLVASQSLSPPKAGKGANQGTGRGSLIYGGGQVGNAGTGQGDPNIPAFFPVMQFGGQHPGGMGVPAVGMAFPGYVAQPNGLGNSEMTWLPVLASAAAGAMGAPYCPPYLAVDGNYHSRPTGQPSALPAPGKDNNLNKPTIESKPQQRPEVTNDEYIQRQNKPRRYSEMSFSQ